MLHSAIISYEFYMKFLRAKAVKYSSGQECSFPTRSFLSASAKVNVLSEVLGHLGWFQQLKVSSTRNFLSLLQVVISAFLKWLKKFCFVFQGKYFRLLGSHHMNSIAVLYKVWWVNQYNLFIKTENKVNTIALLHFLVSHPRMSQTSRYNYSYSLLLSNFSFGKKISHLPTSLVLQWVLQVLK